ncbi:MAG: N-glycosylase/DNA lyase [Candidatus Micrarchaeota archaeon]|nr:N-glycosylase/DNA lyase [Candidatus Micrarchaeota archaeon]
MKHHDLVEFIRNVGIEGARYIEENIDEQYSALVYLSERVDPETFLNLVVRNALVAYQLTSRGEKYWWEFAEYFSKNPNSNMESFLSSCRGNMKYTPTKLSRLRKLEGYSFGLEFYEDMTSLMNTLENILNTTGKTVYFAVKMYGYGARILSKRFIPYPMSIPIPVDSRITKITEALNERDPLRFWNEISYLTSVPPLHIDSILWPLLSGDRNIISKYLSKFTPPRTLLSLVNS